MTVSTKPAAAKPAAPKPAAKKVEHYFLINQLGQGANRLGPFVSYEAAEHYAEHHYHYPAWIVPAVPVGKGRDHRLLDKNGLQLVKE